MTIEERAEKAWGLTNNPVCAIYMLKNGNLLNGSFEGRQRDRDHREIGYFYKQSTRQQPGDSSIYIYKFMRRGNLRVGCHETGFIIELLTTPTEEQLIKLQDMWNIAGHHSIPFHIGVVNRKYNFKVNFLSFHEYIAYMIRHNIYSEYELQTILT